MNFKKLYVVFALNLLISVPTYATVVDEKDLNFMPSTEALMKGEVHFSAEVLDLNKLDKKYPDLSYLDTLGFSHEAGRKMIISKTAYIVNKPAGFFDHITMGDENYLNHVMGDKKITKVEDNVFKIVAPGDFSHSYQMKSYFDSDEISTLPNSRVIRAVTQARKQDVISGSASSSLFREFQNFSDYFASGIQVSSFIPMKENRTLILSYRLMGFKAGNVDVKFWKKNLRKEAEAQKKLIDSYK